MIGFRLGGIISFFLRIGSRADMRMNAVGASSVPTMPADVCVLMFGAGAREGPTAERIYCKAPESGRRRRGKSTARENDAGNTRGSDNGVNDARGVQVGS